ncbi:MAG: DUF1772 domain-containing protein [Bacteroidota bacterium]
MTDIINFALLLVIGTQFGIALASSLIVHPILVQISRPAAIKVFKPFFHKTHNSMITMSIVVTVLALAMSYFTGNWWWFGVSLLMHLNGPYTLKFMMPTNNRLMADNVDPNSQQTIFDLKNWGALHAVRTVWNGGIFIAFLALTFYC